MDRVQVVKQEWASLGGDAADEDEFGGRPIDPQEDAIESAGVYLQDSSNRDETTLVSRSGNDMTFKDGNNSSHTLTQLIQGTGAAVLVWRRHFLLMGG